MVKELHVSNTDFLFLQVIVRFVIDHLNWCNDCDVRMMFDCHQRFPDIQVLELYVELGAATSAGGSSQQHINRDDNVQHTIGWE